MIYHHIQHVDYPNTEHSISRTRIIPSKLARRIRKSASNEARQKAEQKTQVAARILQVIGKDPVAAEGRRRVARLHDVRETMGFVEESTIGRLFRLAYVEQSQLYHQLMIMRLITWKT